MFLMLLYLSHDNVNQASITLRFLLLVVTFQVVEVKLWGLELLALVLLFLGGCLHLVYG